MDDSSLRDFFLKPATPAQRQYEALRAVCIDGLTQKEAAERFAYSYGAFRVLVHQFRASLSAGQPPPFLPPHGEGVVLPSRRRTKGLSRPRRLLPTHAR
jgi:hypothetical protein